MTNPLGAPLQQPQQNPQYPFAIAPPQQQQAPQLGPPPAPPQNLYPQSQAPVQGPVTQEQFNALGQSFNDVRNQLAQLTAAVNGLGQNQAALHDWLVGVANNLTAMIASIAQSIKNEGAIGFLKTLFSGAPTN